MTVQQAYEKFIAYGEMFWAPRTKVYYIRCISYFFNYLEMCQMPADRVALDDLPRNILVQYITWLRSKDRFVGHPLYAQMRVHGQIKSNTVKVYARAVKAFFNYLHNTDVIPYSFTNKLKLPKSDDDQIIPLTASEVVLIDSIFDRSQLLDLRNLCIVHLMLDAGLRSCEVCELTPRDIIFSSNTIVINRSKGNKSRVVLMCPALAELLRTYMDSFHPVGTLFCSFRSSRPLTPTVFATLFNRIRKQTGIQRLHPHLLRHTFATSFILGGGNLETLRILLGHYDYSVTRKYLHLAAQYQILGAEIYRLDPVFFRTGY